MPVSVAVIGHGPSPEGRGWGALIDACDCVIRMWDCHWQASSDYGARYDIGIFTLWPSELEIFRRLCVSAPKQWWGYDHRGFGRGGHVEPLHAPVKLIDPRAWISAAKARGAHGRSGRLELTRGTAAVLAALEWLMPEEIRVVGFDAIVSGVIAAREHAQSAAANDRARKLRTFTARDIGQARSATHDLPAERELIATTAQKIGARIGWGF